MENSKLKSVYYCSIFMEDSRQHKEISTLIENGYNVTCTILDRSKTAKTKYLQTYDNKQYGGYIISEKIDSFYGILNNSIHTIMYSLKLLAILYKDRRKYQIIHVVNFSQVPFCFFLSILLRKKLIYDIFDYFVDSYKMPLLLKRLIKKIDTFYINHVPVVIICTEKRLTQIAPAKPRHIYIIHNTPDDYMERRNNARFQLEDNGRIKVCYVGLITPERPVYTLAHIISERSDIEMHIGGRGKDSEIDCIKELAKKASNKNIFFYDQLPYEETLYLEEKCDIIPSIYDPDVPNHQYAASNKFYEALMLGKPLLMIENTGLDYLVRKYEIGEVSKSIALDDIKCALDLLISKRHKWTIMSTHARRLYESTFNWDAMKEILLLAYKEL